MTSRLAGTTIAWVEQSSLIPRNARGQLLIDYLEARFRYLDRAAWLDRLEQGRLSLDGVRAGAATILQGDQRLVYELPDHDEPEADLSWSLVYEDDRLLGIHKPGQLLVHQQGLAFTRNLVHLVRNSGNPEHRLASPVHRLDRETSGLILFAKHPEDIPDLTELFASRSIHKDYLAVVQPKSEPPKIGDSGRIDLPLGPLPDASNAARQSVDSPKAKAASTLWVCLAQLPGGLCLMLVRPLTGRTHQIRVHLAALGWPILGDKLYHLEAGEYAAWIDEGKKPDSPRLPWPRQALHAWQLTLPWPPPGRILKLTAPLPADMAGLAGAGLEAASLAAEEQRRSWNSLD